MLKFLRLHLGNLCAGGADRVFPANSAELLVVNQFFHRWIRAADGAFRILSYAHLAEAHGERIYEQQAANQRFARAENQLDDFRGLNDAKQSRQHAQHSALGARGYQSWRRRLGIKAAIARTIYSAKDARLPFKAKD